MFRKCWNCFLTIEFYRVLSGSLKNENNTWPSCSAGVGKKGIDHDKLDRNGRSFSPSFKFESGVKGFSNHGTA